MSKWKGFYDSGRKYNSDWEREFPWVTKATDGKEGAYCKVCRKGLLPRKSVLALHEKSKGHTSRTEVERKKSTAVLSSFVQSRVRPASTSKDNVKEAELELAVAVSCHSPILAIDHLGEVIRRLNFGL